MLTDTRALELIGLVHLELPELKQGLYVGIEPVSHFLGERILRGYQLDDRLPSVHGELVLGSLMMEWRFEEIRGPVGPFELCAFDSHTCVVARLTRTRSGDNLAKCHLNAQTVQCEDCSARARI